MDTGKIDWAIQLYLDLQRKEKSVETAEIKLNSWLMKLSAEEFNLYVEKTVELDRRREDAKR